MKWAGSLLLCSFGTKMELEKNTGRKQVIWQSRCACWSRTHSHKVSNVMLRQTLKPNKLGALTLWFWPSVNHRRATPPAVAAKNGMKKITLRRAFFFFIFSFGFVTLLVVVVGRGECVRLSDKCPFRADNVVLCSGTNVHIKW